MLKENGDKIPAADKEAIEVCIKDLKEAIESNDTQKIKDKTEALQNASMKMGEAMYKAQQAQGNPNPAGDQPQEEKKEDVVDADY